MRKVKYRKEDLGRNEQERVKNKWEKKNYGLHVPPSVLMRSAVALECGNFPCQLLQ